MSQYYDEGHGKCQAGTQSVQSLRQSVMPECDLLRTTPSQRWLTMVKKYARFSTSMRRALSAMKRVDTAYARIVPMPDKLSEKCEYREERRTASEFELAKGMFFYS